MKNSFKLKNYLIIALLLLGCISFYLIQFVILPTNAKQEEEYKSAQYNPITHDLTSILDYKSKYMGDFSNIANLFAHLPLSTSPHTFRLFSDELTVEINYELNVLEAGQENCIIRNYSSSGPKEEQTTIYLNEVNKSLIYNSTAAFSLIENLSAIRYNFSDKSFFITREAVKTLYNQDLSSLLSKAEWNEKVQHPLTDPNYVTTTISSLTLTE